MYDGVHVGSKDWRKEMVWSFKMGAPALPIRRCVALILRSFEQVLVAIFHRALPFLPGSGLHSEFTVTHSKQTMAPFLPGSRIGTKHSIRRGVSSPLFARSIQFAP
jgi:hypothetical protein